MRVFVAVVLLAGCGRIDFAPLTDASTEDTSRQDARVADIDASGLCTDGDARIEHAGTCYSRFDSAVPYLSAAAACANIGASLATISAADEVSVITSLATGTAWIGLTDRHVEGTFAWQSLEPLGATRWAVSQPDADGDCVEMTASGAWNDTNCSTPKAYYCERRLATPPCTEGEVHVEFGGHCYWRIATNVTYADAVTECLSAGGHPPVITSQAEDTAILTLFNNWSWIGLRDLPQPGAFEWETGEPLVYTNWVPGEPNMPGGAEHCAHIWSGGDWNNSVCDAAIAQIMCERP